MNLPDLPKSTNTLYVGMGGGYDIFGAIPIHEKLKTNAVFANIAGDVKSMVRYAPFHSLEPRNGVRPLVQTLKSIVSMYDIDTIIGVDGGVDCLMQGDEEDSGTVLQDFVMLAALDALKDVKVIVACVGFGTETDEDMNHYRVLENIAQLTKDNAFLGSCSLTGDMAEFAHYKNAVDNWSNTRRSHIQTKVIAAVEGEFGNPPINADPNLSAAVFEKRHDSFINPLMSIYWFFRLEGIIKNNKIIPHIKDTITITDALMKYRKVVTRIRDRKVIPL